MKVNHLIFTLLLIVALPALSFGQNKRSSRAGIAKTYAHYTNPDSTLDHRNFFVKMGGKMGLPDAASMVLEQEMPGKNGWAHFKFQQYHAGLPIIGATYILHEKGGWVRKANGHFTPNPDAAATPTVSAERAIHLAQEAMKAKVYGNPPVPTLCFIDAAFPKTSELLRLAYQTDVTSVKPFDKQRFFVDALNGTILAQFTLIEKKGVPSTAATNYYGTVNITTDSLGPASFMLHDPTRGDGITVLDADLNVFTNTSSHWDLKNAKKDEVALDAHYCSTRFYDMMLGDFNWKGLDGNGKALKVQVHNNGAGAVNAFWDGEQTNFGDGDCLNGPLTTLEVVGHEFTHGVVDFTSKLIYDSESGAMNESLADMFGKALERKADPANFSWVLGHSIFLTTDGKPFRVMDDPKSVEMPAFYGGEFWDGANDVHVNSSIGNLWFSMIVDGKQGVNEANENFDVAALGMDKSAQIAFFTNKNYLTPNSDYNDFYQNSLDAAEELYGPGAPEKAVVEEAWKAVGLPGSGSGSLSFDLSISTKGFAVQNSCEPGIAFPITIDIENTGSDPYLPSMGGSVTLSTLDLADFKFDLTEAIQPGEVFSMVVDNWFLPPAPNSYFVNIELDVSDDQPVNNSTYSFFNLAEFAANDLDIYAFIQKPACFSTEFPIFAYVDNQSCAPVAAGSTLNFSIENSSGTVLWSVPYVLDKELAGFDYRYLNFTANLSSAPMEELTCKVAFAGDPDLTNNESILISPNVDPILGDYLNKFTNDNELNNLLLVNSTVSPNLTAYLGKFYVGSTGLLDDPSFFTTCPNYADNFNNDGYGAGVNTTLSACADLSAFQNSVLSFDLVQFRSDPANLYSSMLQVKWDGNETGNQIFLGQTEGQLVHHEIDLPHFFKGGLEIKFYTEIGQGDLSPSTFSTDDVQLLDNLRIKTNTVGTDETHAPNGIQISPNPAHDNIEVRSEVPLKKLELVSIDGKLLKTAAADGNYAKMALTGLENGIFFLRMQAESGVWVVKKVVKME